MGIDKMDSSAVYTLFEELKQKIIDLGSKSIQTVTSVDYSEEKKIVNELQNLANQKQFTPEQVKELRENMGGFAAGLLKKSNEKIDEVFTELTSLFNQIEERIKALNIPMNFVIRKEHSFSIDFKNSKATIAMIAMGFIILILISININQYRSNKSYKSTDLKYRFIKMHRGVSENDLIRLENIFHYPDSAYIVKNIKKQVLDYERRLEQQIRKQEQIRMNDKKNKQLNNEIKDLKVK